MPMRFEWARSMPRPVMNASGLLAAAGNVRLMRFRADQLVAPWGRLATRMSLAVQPPGCWRQSWTASHTVPSLATSIEGLGYLRMPWAAGLYCASDPPAGSTFCGADHVAP